MFRPCRISLYHCFWMKGSFFLSISVLYITKIHFPFLLNSRVKNDATMFRELNLNLIKPSWKCLYTRVLMVYQRTLKTDLILSLAVWMNQCSKRESLTYRLVMMVRLATVPERGRLMFRVSRHPRNVFRREMKGIQSNHPPTPPPSNREKNIFKLNDNFRYNFLVIERNTHKGEFLCGSLTSISWCARPLATTWVYRICVN